MSIRSLAERLFQEGSLGEAVPAGRAASLGREAHARLQSRGIEGYRAEVELSRSFQGSHVRLEVSGRADGIYEAEGRIHVEEIKSTALDPAGLAADWQPAHVAQLGLYAWLHALDQGLDEICLDLVYIRRGSGEIKVFESVASLEWLDELYGKAVADFLSWLDCLAAHREELEAGLESLGFPFPDFRPGQKEAAREVFRCIREGGSLFLQAPTGIGKTMAVLYAALKALGRGHAEKLFYFTAKGSGAAAAEKALAILAASLPGLRWISITAKAKICFMRPAAGGEGLEDLRGWRPPCDPATCPYARDYFSKARRALAEVGDHASLTRTAIEELARKHLACPFELSLDLSLHCDAIVADCNYGFDPGVRLKRYFLGGRTDFAFLIDEAHNLVDRARSMHSGSLSKRRVLEARRTGSPAEKKALSRLNAALLELRRDFPANHEEARPGPPAPVVEALEATVGDLDSLIEGGATLSPPVLELYWDLVRLAGILSRYDPASHRTLVSKSKGDFRLDFLCIDPSGPLGEVLGNQKAAVFFSATLAPPRYFMRLLAPAPGSRYVDLPSPFPPENCAYLADCRVSTRWKDREGNLGAYSGIVREAFAAVAGNLLVFSPSFAFQEALLSRLLAGGAMPATWMAQGPAMAEAEREAFVKAFEEGRGRRGFAVSGGSFAESVDLVGESLVGIIVFGVGLPQVNATNNLYRDFFEARFGDGYDWAYLYPGLNRVIQAAGRVIRSGTDRGFVLLVDERYATPEYRRLLPPHWELRSLRGYDNFAEFLPAGLTSPGGERSK
jgi:DNA excision repair protein ERCC-2